MDRITLEARLRATPPNPIATLTLIHRDGQATRGDPQARLQRKIARYRAMLQQGYAAEDVRRLIRLMEHILRLPEPLRHPARTALQQVEEEELGMSSFVTSFEEIGMAKGQVVERQALVLRLLNRKVGELPPAIQQRVEALSPEALLVLSEALLDFATLADLMAWLEQQRSTVGEAPASEASDDSGAV
ncbi:MAG: DUF4351 domain-containing protein [Blastochloris sp.]|nr:DUF4351 domain-containing protein [Blastochloris sp.]